MQAHVTIIILMEWIMLPMPVRGETIPPRKKGTAPSRAEATPRLVLMVLRDMVMPSGVIIPTQNSIRIRAASKLAKG